MFTVEIVGIDASPIKEFLLSQNQCIDFGTVKNLLIGLVPIALFLQ